MAAGLFMVCILLLVSSIEGILFDDGTTSPLVHGGWSGWTAWGACSASCGVGLQRRDRSCNNPWPSKDGNHCFGDNINYRVCADVLCTDGWDNWSAWSSCGVTCGQGLKHRHRTCSDRKRTLLGGGCIGTDQENIECDMKPCNTVVYFYAQDPHYSMSYDQTRIQYSTVTINIGGGYQAVGDFIAPREGLYLFTSQVCKKPNFEAWTAITKNGVVVQDSQLRNGNDIICRSMQAAIEMSVGDLVTVLLKGRTQVMDTPYVKCSFSGMLIK